MVVPCFLSKPSMTQYFKVLQKLFFRNANSILITQQAYIFFNAEKWALGFWKLNVL